jgi:hypothetical protein
VQRRSWTFYEAIKIKPWARVPIEDETVEDWAIGSFGEHLFRTFFKPYHPKYLSRQKGWITVYSWYWGWLRKNKTY